MLLLLAIFYLSQRVISAVPIPEGLVVGAILPPPTSALCACPNNRSIWDIIWSCLATIFACSWVSVHPNIPAPGDRWWKISLRRLELMFWALIAPELIILWAMRQWYGARLLAKEYYGQGWTKTHGYFLQMGGFMLYKGGAAEETLLPEKFKQLLQLGKIEFPTITEAQIQDRSKGDGLSKSLVILQTSWFIVQCIARGVQKIDLTQLELVTLAFAMLNGSMFFMWWNKPFDVRCPVPVYLLDHPIQPIRFEQEQSISNDESLFTRIWSSTTRMPCQIFEIIISFIFSCHSVSLRAWNASKGAGILWIFFAGPLYLILFVYKRLNDMSESESGRSLSNNRMRVSTFYALKIAKPSLYKSYTISASLAVAFGAIHCVGWSSPFPSDKEQLFWRVSSVVIASIPCTMVIFGILSDPKSNDSRRTCAKEIVDVATRFLLSYLLAYFAARIFLLLEAIASLRKLQAGAYTAIEWTSFIPHV